MKSTLPAHNGISNNYNPTISTGASLEVLKKVLDMAIAAAASTNATAPNTYETTKTTQLNNSTNNFKKSAENMFCQCLSQLNHFCTGDSVAYGSLNTKVETLLDAMRFREELDLQQRQKRRLQRAKHKVTTWLTKANNKMWASSPQILIPPRVTADASNYNRTNSLQYALYLIFMVLFRSGGSYIPEIVISNSEEVHCHAIGPGPSISNRQNSCTPSLSLLYDFNNGEEDMDTNGLRKSFDGSDADLSQFSDLSFNTIGSAPDLAVQIQLNEYQNLLPGGRSHSPQMTQQWAIQNAIRQHRSVSVVAAHLKTTGAHNKHRPAPMSLFPTAAPTGSSQSVPTEYA